MNQLLATMACAAFITLGSPVCAQAPMSPGGALAPPTCSYAADHHRAAVAANKPARGWTGPNDRSGRTRDASARLNVAYVGEPPVLLAMPAGPAVPRPTTWPMS
jgi:hypothetical protein